MDEKATIQILIPTFNNVTEIGGTLASIWEQDYDSDGIYVTIVDFGSTDGTYENILKLGKKNLGIYSMEHPKSRGLIVSTAARVLGYVHPGGQYSFAFVLYPGETLYKQCVRKCVEALIRYQYTKPVMVITETDVRLGDGTIKRQKPLFSSEKIIDGKIEVTEYVKRGYQHQIFEMVTSIEKEKYKGCGEKNEQRFWNKAVRANHQCCAVYLPEVLACTKAIVYDDELEEILHRWEAIISLIRFHEAKFGHIFDVEYAVKAKKNLAEYALWRSYLLYLRGGEWKEIEDCFLISTLIDPGVKDTEIHQLMQQLAIVKNQSVIERLNSIFSEREYTVI